MRERGEILLEAVLFLPVLAGIGWFTIDFGLRSYTRAAITQTLRSEIESLTLTGNNLDESYDKLSVRLKSEIQSEVRLGLALVDHEEGVLASAGEISLGGDAAAELSRERTLNPFVERGVLIEAATASGVRHRQFRLLRRQTEGAEW
jgi:hypothetical protein